MDSMHHDGGHDHDHGDVDHSTMMMMADDDDTNNSAFCNNHHGMIMYMDGFRLSLAGNSPCLNLLFSNWTLNTRIKFFVAMIAVFCFAISIEGFAKLRHHVVCLVRNNNNTTRQPSSSSSLLPHWKRKVLRSCIPIMHGLQALLGYTLMLVSMTFSVELLFCVVFGLGVGYGIFFRISDDDDNNDNAIVQHVTTNPCCEFMEEESKETTMTLQRQQQQEETETLIVPGVEEDDDVNPPRNAV